MNIFFKLIFLVLGFAIGILFDQDLKQFADLTIGAIAMAVAVKYL